MGGNGHSCDLEGEIHKGQAILDTFDGAGPCKVEFTQRADGVSVLPQAESCREFCGMRADFTGIYRKLSSACQSASRARSRERFKALYDRKAFAEAYAILAPLVQECESTLNWLELGWIRNDLAITQYRLKRPADCLTTLEPLAADAKLTDRELNERFPPTDATNYLPIVQAARINLKLCDQLRGKR
jgi:hypothetical protein